MTKSENLFHLIIKENPNGIIGTMFGANCIKSINGKTAAFLWGEDMVFKLDQKDQEEALKINGWVSIPRNQSEKWNDFTQKALEYVNSLKQ